MLLWLRQHPDRRAALARRANTDDGDHGDRTELGRQIESIRWHLTRYDAARTSVASRASFIMAAAAVLIASVAVLSPAGIQVKLLGGKISLALLGLGGLGTLTCAIISMLAAMNALVSIRPWRTLYGNKPPSGSFYVPSDTLRQLKNYEVFKTELMAQRLSDDRDAALVALWL